MVDEFKAMRNTHTTGERLTESSMLAMLLCLVSGERDTRKDMFAGALNTDMIVCRPCYLVAKA
jgi:hypothetical protein